MSNNVRQFAYRLNSHSLPIGLATFVMFYVFMPPGFPDLHAKSAPIRLEKLKEIDIIGAFLVFGSCAFVVSALEEAGLDYPWSSPTIIVLLCLSGVGFLGFPFWQKRVAQERSVQGIFPWPLMCNRVFWGALL